MRNIIKKLAIRLLLWAIAPKMPVLRYFTSVSRKMSDQGFNLKAAIDADAKIVILSKMDDTDAATFSFDQMNEEATKISDLIPELRFVMETHQKVAEHVQQIKMARHLQRLFPFNDDIVSIMSGKIREANSNF